MFQLPSKTLWRLLSKLPDEPMVPKYAAIQRHYRHGDLTPIADATQLIHTLEQQGLYKSSALCRYHSDKPIDYAKLIETALQLEAIDRHDVKTVLKELVQHQDIPYFQYILGRILLPTQPDDALRRLKQASTTVPKARHLYAQHLITQSPALVKTLLDATTDKTPEDHFYHYLSDKSLLDSLVHAAESGLMEAQYNLGCLYLEGRLNGGIKEAQCWFFLSALQGYKPAKDNLKQFIQ